MMWAFFAVLAAAQADTRSEIEQLALGIARDVQMVPASPEQLAATKRLLVQAAQQLQSASRQDCDRFTRAIYEKRFAASDSIDQRIRQECASIQDVQILEYAYAIEDRKYDSLAALARAQPIAADAALTGRVEALKFVTQVRSQALEMQSAFQRAVRDLREHPNATAPCLQQAYTRLNTRNVARTALDKALDECQ